MLFIENFSTRLLPPLILLSSPSVQLPPSPFYPRYVRLNRTRLKGQEGDEEAFTGLSTLYEILLSMTVLMAPFTPFLTEFLYQHLRKLHPNSSSSSSSLPPDAIGKADSVHYVMLPMYDEARLNPACEERMATLQTVIELGRMVRERNNISLKTPVKEVIVVSKDQGMLWCLPLPPSSLPSLPCTL